MRQKSKVIAVAVQKGGVAKSTTANALLYSAKKKGQKVVIVDLDPQASQTNAFFGQNSRVFMGNSDKNITNCFYDKPVKGLKVVTEKMIPNPRYKKDFGAMSYTTESMEIDFIPSNKDLLDLIEGDEFKYADKIQKLVNYIDSLRDEFDLIILDCPPSFGIITKAALLSSDIVLNTIAAKAVDEDGLAGFYMDFEALANKYEMPLLKNIYVVPTLYDKRIGNSKEMLPKIKSIPNILQTFNKIGKIDCKVLTPIPTKAAIQEAPGYRMFLEPYIHEFSRNNMQLILIFDSMIDEMIGV